jgi:hypothetical protein
MLMDISLSPKTKVQSASLKFEGVRYAVVSVNGSTVQRKIILFRVR